MSVFTGRGRSDTDKQAGRHPDTRRGKHGSIYGSMFVLTDNNRKLPVHVIYVQYIVVYSNQNISWDIPDDTLNS